MQLRFLCTIAAASLTLSACGSHATPSASMPANGGSSSFVRPDIGQTGQTPTNWVNIQLAPGNHDTHFIIQGPDKAMWFTEGVPDKFARAAMDGSVVEYPLPSGVLPSAIAIGRDNLIYINDEAHATILQAGTDGIVKNTFSIPSGNGANLIKPGPNGNLWFTEFPDGPNPMMIGEISPSGVITEHDFHHPNTGTITSPFDLVTGPDGNVWFSNSNEVSIANINPATGAVTNYPLLSQGIDCQPYFILVGPDKKIWALCDNQNVGKQYLVRMTTSGTATAKSLKHGGYSWAVGPDKAVWMVAGTLTRLSKSGGETTFAFPSGVLAARTIASGPDANLWIADLSQTLNPQVILVYVKRILTVSPSSVTLTGPGAVQTLSVTEQNYKGKWTASSSNTGVATVAPGGTSGTFVVTSISSGSCTVTVSDSTFNTFAVAVSVI